MNTGTATQSTGPCELAMANDAIDISEMSKSPNISWRQNSSGANSGVAVNARPAGTTVPSRTGRVRALGSSPALSVSVAAMAMVREAFHASRPHVIPRPPGVTLFACLNYLHAPAAYREAMAAGGRNGPLVIFSRDGTQGGGA